MGWDPLKDLLKGTESFGDSSTLDSKAWAKKFDTAKFSLFKIESRDKSRTKTVSKFELQGKRKDEPMLSKIEIKEMNGVNVYIG